MKTIHKILSILVFISSMLCSISCNKQLDKHPYDSTDEVLAFATSGDFDNALRGMYRPSTTSRATAGYFGGSVIILPDLLADNLILNTAGRRSNSSFHYWTYNSESTTSLFGGAYILIRRANAILANIDNGVLTGATKDNTKGEALAQRAWLHFYMACMYCKIPSAKNFVGNAIDPAVDLGIPYVTSTDPKLLPARESIAGLYNKIISDLQTAESLISATNAAANGRWHKAAVAGLLAKVYLYMGDYANAAAEATNSLTLNGNVGTPTDLANIFKDATANGVLFKIKLLDADQIRPGTVYSQPNGTSYISEYVCAYDFYQLYSATDVRKSSYIQSLPAGGFNRLHIIKHVGRASGSVDVVDIKVLRVADVLLIRAEANARLNKLTDALTDLNKLKQNRYNPYVAFNSADPVVVLDEILKERRLELAFEGHRFFDLKRLYRSVRRDNTHGDRADGTGPTYPSIPDAVKMDSTDHRMQLPFSQSEINVNPNFKQNPGYGS